MVCLLLGKINQKKSSTKSRSKIIIQDKKLIMLNNPKNSGIVTIIGEVNVGKSSLLNILVKKDVSIITHKSNTTNKQIKV